MVGRLRQRPKLDNAATCFSSTVRPTVHTNLSRERSFRERFSNRRNLISLTEFSSTDTNPKLLGMIAAFSKWILCFQIPRNGVIIIPVYSSSTGFSILSTQSHSTITFLFVCSYRRVIHMGQGRSETWIREFLEERNTAEICWRPWRAQSGACGLWTQPYAG